MINLALFGKELRENRVKFYLCFLALAVLAVLLPLIYGPTRDFLSKIIFLDESIRRGIDFIGASYNNYAWSQWTAKNLPQLATLAAIVLGMGVIAGEISYGTALFLASKPITRREIYTTKAAAGLFLLALCVLGSTLLFVLVSAWKGFALDYGAFILSAVITYAGAVLIYLGTAFFSGLFSEPVKAGVAAALFWLAASVPGYFPNAAPFSLFYQMKAVSYWVYGQNPIVPLGLSLVIAGLLYEAGVWLWSRREL
jgi:ABC-type transport system involved in multi-copper enzyme maturation permease subunit